MELEQLKKDENTINTYRMNFRQKIMGVMFAPTRTINDLIHYPSFFYPIMLIVFFSLSQSLVIMPFLIEMINNDLVIPQGQNPESVRKYVITVAKVTSLITGTFGSLIFCVFFAFILWCGGKLLARVNFENYFTIALYGAMPKVIIGNTISTIFVVISDGVALKMQVTSLGTFLTKDGSNGFLFAFLNSIDVFWIWFIIFISIGSSKLLNVSFNKVAIPLFSLCTLYLLIISYIFAKS